MDDRLSSGSEILLSEKKSNSVDIKLGKPILADIVDLTHAQTSNPNNELFDGQQDAYPNSMQDEVQPLKLGDQDDDSDTADEG